MNTRLTELLGIRFPIIQGGMAWVATPRLVAAVSNAGGLGTLGGSTHDPPSLRRAIAEIRGLTDRPFAVNLLAWSPVLDSLLDVVIEQKVPVVSTGGGNPIPVIRRLAPHGIICLPVLSSVTRALRAEAAGAPAVVLEGMESGGHVGELTTFVLVREGARRLRVPVVAAGGIADAAGLVAALALGAEGVQLGTRFICTRECEVHPRVKQAFLAARCSDTVVTRHLTGLKVRVLRNRLAENLLDAEGGRPGRWQLARREASRMRQAFLEGDVEEGSLMAGQVVGLIDDLPSCAELVQGLAEGVRPVLSGLGERLGGP